MNSTFAYAAAALGLIWALVHTFLGGRQVALPLRQSDLPEVVRATAWMCWHMVTATLFLAAALPVLALWTGREGLLMAALLVNIAIMLAGLISAPVLRVSYKTLPQGWLFVPNVLLCALALWA